MTDLNFQIALNSIQSEDACKALSLGLIQLANTLEIRRQEIAQTRQNYKRLDDKKDLAWAANRVLQFDINGGCPASECRKICARLFVNETQVWSLYQMKLSAYRADELKKRNQKIKKWHMNGVPHKKIALRTGLSKGMISKIANSKISQG